MGLAVGDEVTGVASPLEIVPYEGVEHAAEKIAAIAQRIGAARVVLGLPTLEDGSRGPASRRSLRLAEALGSIGIEVRLQNEFLSTNEARRRARFAGRPSRKPVDDIAAQVILEEFLATLSMTAESERRSGK